ncbi:MAG: 1-acyl-sn-glycerol-3-phosphate acyltransferase [Planctomycetaceae bacterium]|nr:1-acyl-sn-glycerol-3-phosphate acyltransferase [Planctomycetaceae bacterium]
MNRQPYQTPPRHWESRLSPWWVWLCHSVRRGQVHGRQQIERISCSGEETFRAAQAANQGILLTPNHSTHFDSNCLYLALEELGSLCHFMTAWQVFGVASRWEQWSYQRHGCFSVDRERTDLKAFRHAVEILESSPCPLVIFPEGDIHHVNDRVFPFREGAAAIALSAAKKQQREIVSLPVAIKFEYLEDPTPSLLQVMGKLEERLLLSQRADLPLLNRVFRIARTVLCIQEIEEFGHVRPGDLKERLETLSRTIVDRVASVLQRPATEGPIPEVVKDLRRRIIDALENEERPTDEQIRLQQSMGDLFRAVQLYSYPGDYLQEQPSRERLAETIDKLEEDVLQVPYPTVHGRRQVRIAFGEPVPVKHIAGERNQVAQLTQRLETSVQALLDAFNAR